MKCTIFSLPLFAAKYCGQPPVVASAHVLSSTGVQYEDTVKYECDPGFGFNGADFITCQADGTWTTPPVCSRELIMLTATIA
jgi:hypothetical protein